jgi:hypothetical protein
MKRRAPVLPRLYESDTQQECASDDYHGSPIDGRQSRAYPQQDHAEIAGVAHLRIRPISNDAMVIGYKQRAGVESTKRVVAHARSAMPPTITATPVQPITSITLPI